MPRYRINYAFERATDDPDDVLRFGQSYLYVETDVEVRDQSPELMEILRTLGLNNEYIKVGLQAIVEVDAAEELEIVGDNSDRFTTD